jgi:hypothetical protein
MSGTGILCATGEGERLRAKAQKQEKLGEMASRVARPVTRQKGAGESEIVEGFRKARAALESATRDIAALRGHLPSRRR